MTIYWRASAFVVSYARLHHNGEPGGASEDAPVSLRQVRSTPLGPPPVSLTSPLAVSEYHLVEAAYMAIILNYDGDLLTIPFSTAIDFTDLADCRDHFAETLIECHDPAQKLALLGSIGKCLALLRPPHLIGQYYRGEARRCTPAF